MYPRGTTLHVNATFLMIESNSFTVQVCFPWSLSNTSAISAVLSCVMLACIATASRRTPKNMRRVVRPSTFSDLTATLTREHSESMCCMFLWDSNVEECRVANMTPCVQGSMADIGAVQNIIKVME